MTSDAIDALRKRLAKLLDLSETSDALRSYLETALSRDPVDVLGEIEVLSGFLSPDSGDAKT